MTSRSTLAAIAAAGFVAAAPSFIAPSGARQDSVQALRGSSVEQGFASSTSASSSGYGVATAAASLAAVGAAAGVAGKSRKGKQSSAVSVSAVRRDLAVAYEDSGIELFDNGKFAQGLVGADGAWGRYEFDPVGFSSTYHEFVPYFREAELKHGRICMLAWIGLAVPDFVRIPGERYSFEACPVTIDAHDQLNSAAGVNVQVLFWVTIFEFCCCKKVFEWNSLEVAGDYGFGHQFLPKDEEGQKRMRMAELKNGRLAMVAFGGAITQAVLTRHPFPWLY